MSGKNHSRKNICGVLLLDKPADITSNAALGWARRLYQAAKAGHTGTLDPFATGLLPICFGEATKFSQFHLEADKSYRATLKLGQVSSTGDTEGEITRIRPVDVDPQRVQAVLSRFMGAQSQIPPMHSALKRDGVALYKLARQGIEVDRPPRSITIYALSLIKLEGEQLVLDVTCSKGTYIRVLAEDIGEALGCGAYLSALRRTATGHFNVAEAVTLQTLEQWGEEQRSHILRDADQLITALPAITLDLATIRAVQNGKTPRQSLSLSQSGCYRLYASQGDENANFIGLVDIQRDADGLATIVARRLMSTADL